MNEGRKVFQADGCGHTQLMVCYAYGDESGNTSLSCSTLGHAPAN